MVPARLPGVTHAQRRRVVGADIESQREAQQYHQEDGRPSHNVASHATAPWGSRPSTRRICGQATIATSDPSRQAAWRSVMTIAVSRSLTNDRVSLTP